MDAAKAVCGKEALDLLNCVVDSNYDQEKCLHLLQSLRQCVLSKFLATTTTTNNNAIAKYLIRNEKKVKKFSLPDEKPSEDGSKKQN